MIAAATIGGEVNIKKIDCSHLDVVTSYLKKMDIDVHMNKNNLFIKSDGKYNAINIETSEYPGFPTDLQAQWMAMMIKANGDSTIKENIYSDRFTHISELVRMGANIKLKKEIAYIGGVKRIYPAPVMCTDIRASAALVISALSADGQSEISRIYHIDRGYEKIENKFSQLGANIKRVKS